MHRPSCFLLFICFTFSSCFSFLKPWWYVWLSESDKRDNILKCFAFNTIFVYITLIEKHFTPLFCIQLRNTEDTHSPTHFIFFFFMIWFTIVNPSTFWAIVIFVRFGDTIELTVSSFMCMSMIFNANNDVIWCYSC